MSVYKIIILDTGHEGMIECMSNVNVVDFFQWTLFYHHVNITKLVQCKECNFYMILYLSQLYNEICVFIILGKSPIEDFYNGSSQSRVVLAKPRLGGFGSSSFASSSNKGLNPFGKWVLTSFDSLSHSNNH